MRWSKLKSEIESRFCESLRKRVSINSTRYGNCTCGHAWLTLDKKVIANFCTRAFWNNGPEFDQNRNKYVVVGNREFEEKGKYQKLFNDYGELSRQNVYESCWTYLHDLSIEEALLSSDPIIQSLSVIDKRVGKRRIKKINKSELHPLAKKLIETRLKAEKTEKL